MNAFIKVMDGRGIALALLATACTAQPAPARGLDQRLAEMPDEAYGTVAGFVADGALTCMIVKDGGREANPLISAFVGKRPSCGDMALLTAAKSILYLAGISVLQDHDPRSARTAARITLIAQTGIVGYQLGVALKVRF